MSDDGNHQFGLSRRELEYECRWITRHVKNDQMVKLLTDLIVALIDKNNAAIAKHQGNHDDHKPGAP
jgi:hypothetical protein